MPVYGLRGIRARNLLREAGISRTAVRIDSAAKETL
jgi:hypothetical protein